jgi:hypothetical protein
LKIVGVDEVINRLYEDRHTVWKPALANWGCWCPRDGLILVIHDTPFAYYAMVIFSRPAHNCFGFTYGLN